MNSDDARDREAIEDQAEARVTERSRDQAQDEDHAGSFEQHPVDPKTNSDALDRADEEVDREDDTAGAERDEPGNGADQRQEEGGRSPRRRRRRPPRDRDEDAHEGDERAKHALAFVRDVVTQMEMDCRARLRHGRPEPDGGSPEIVIEIFGRDAGRIIGKKGQVLAALQFLTHRVVNRSGLERRHVLVDAEGYRMRRESSLASMARKLGRQAVDQGKIITFEPMNPRDRRVVHLALAKFEGVITKSDGEGDDRRVQIIPVRR